MRIHIGIDDTDSTEGGCTTYLAALIASKLVSLGAQFSDYPNLVRLNPNIPWKTRGNGAVALRIDVEDSLYEQVKELVLAVVEDNCDMSLQRADPGIVFRTGNIPDTFEDFSRRALQDVVLLSEAIDIVGKSGAEAFGYGCRRGIIGALAAVGEDLDSPCTYELIAYRERGFWGTPRRIDGSSVAQMNEMTENETFNNIDPETARILITPHGPDPVLCGIRAETPTGALEAFKMLSLQEPLERWLIFKTNHGTDAHLAVDRKIRELKPYLSCTIAATVYMPPKILTGGHVIIKVKDDSGTIDCAAYEPSGNLRKQVLQLMPGDEIRVSGGIRPKSQKHGLTLNIEKLEVIHLVENTRVSNPKCPTCMRTMKSSGRHQGFKCKGCEYRSQSLLQSAERIPRGVSKGIYLLPPRSHRHLTKPLSRYGRHTQSQPRGMVERWYGQA